jgi:hypothetical protein
MSAGANQNQSAKFDTVNDKPIWFDMEFSMPNPFTFKQVVAILTRKKLPIEQRKQWRKYLYDVLSSYREALKFTPEGLGGI